MTAVRLRSAQGLHCCSWMCRLAVQYQSRQYQLPGSIPAKGLLQLNQMPQLGQNGLLQGHLDNACTTGHWLIYCCSLTASAAKQVDMMMTATASCMQCMTLREATASGSENLFCLFGLLAGVRIDTLYLALAQPQGDSVRNKLGDVKTTEGYTLCNLVKQQGQIRAVLMLH